MFKQKKLFKDGFRCYSLLSDIHKYSKSKPQKFTIDGLINSKNLNEQNRTKICQEELKNRISHKILEVESFPYGLSHINSIKKIHKWYITSFHELQEFEKNYDINDNQEYSKILKKIYERHSPTLMNISKGIFEWKKDLEDSYGEQIDFFKFGNKKYMLNSIEHSLNSFYDSRISIRLLIDHYLNLNVIDKEKIGIVSLKTEPLDILLQAWLNASFVSTRDYGFCPNIYVKGERLDEKLVEKYKHLNFPYIDYHMYYILFEVLKNSIRATIEKEKQTGTMEDIHIDFSEIFEE